MNAQNSLSATGPSKDSTNPCRALPHSDEAEKCLLASLLLNPEAVTSTFQRVGHESFYDLRHKLICRTIEEMAAAREPLDLTTLTQKLQDNQRLDEAGGVAYVTEVTNSAPSAANLDFHVKTVRQKHALRRAIEIADTVAAKAFDSPGSVETLLRRAKEEFATLSDESKTAEPLLIQNAIDIVKTELPASEDIITGILPQKSRAIISAPAKLGKTRYALGLAIGIATGKDVMGFKVTRSRRVLYFQAEVSTRNLQDRLKKMLAAFTADEKLVRENLLFCNDPRLKLTRAEATAAIREAIERHRPEVVIFDPLYKYNTGDENNVQDMTRFFDPLDAMIVEHGVTVIVVHHHGKGRGEHLTTAAHSNRGSSTIADWADSLLTLTFEDAENDVVKLAFTLRNAEEPSPMAFYRNRETLWFDPLPDHQFAAKSSSHKVTEQDVARTIGTGNQVAYTQLAETIAKQFKVSLRTAKDAIKRAADAGIVRKNAADLYEVVQGAAAL